MYVYKNLLAKKKSSVETLKTNKWFLRYCQKYMLLNSIKNNPLLNEQKFCYSMYVYTKYECNKIPMP